MERIGGPLLLLSACDDQAWPSATLSEVAMARLRRHAHPFPCEHASYAGAGHLSAQPPYGPTELVVPGPGVRFAMGGSVPATSAARTDARLRTIEWFSERLPI